MWLGLEEGCLDQLAMSAAGSELSGAASVHTFAMLDLIQPLHLSGRD